MSNSPLSEEIQDFRQELQNENLQRLQSGVVRKSWIVRWVPRFSLLTLLLVTMLFGLGAAYVSLKRSTQVTIELQERELRFQKALAEMDRYFLGSRLNLMGGVDTLAISQRFDWQPDEYPVMVLLLDPAKNYVIHASQTNVAAKDFNSPEQSIVIRAIGPRERNRSHVVLRIVGSMESIKDPANLYEGNLACVVEAHRLDSSLNSYMNNTSVYLIRPTTRAHVQRTKELKEFFQLWNRQKTLNKGKPTELFHAIDSQSPLKNRSGLFIWIEEIQPDAINAVPNRVLFPSREAN